MFKGGVLVCGILAVLVTGWLSFYVGWSKTSSHTSRSEIQLLVDRVAHLEIQNQKLQQTVTHSYSDYTRKVENVLKQLADNNQCGGVVPVLDGFKKQLDDIHSKMDKLMQQPLKIGGAEQDKTSIIKDVKNDVKVNVVDNDVTLPKPHLKLVIGVLASYKHFDRRQGIRETWTQYTRGTDKEKSWTYKFFLGMANSTLTEEAEKENEKYKDIIFVSYLDTYQNISLKTMAMARWATETYNFDYMLKIDDDSFLRLDWLLDELDNLPKEKVYMGISIGNFRPDRDPKSIWYMPPELFPNEKGPVTITGPGYILSYDCASYLAEQSRDPNLVVLPLEDVNTAVIMVKMGVVGRASHRFHPGLCPCTPDMILSHWCSPNDFRRYYRNSLEKDNMCR